ncbi:uncharacterized protein BO88DRAFT_489802 [Aspergillus vadensis CBS 113365]|uniref:Uncharacterized protein n=1 Tax=Aspergillus vadensis (strain CBS 113365 / IMI 142717 / IBT 24658) TaxID=1448311 RepID=A0A319B200_ASPVC|nr:hypothetical protein BO88DRAFT_489802 [Aspergillus vadensis CBS 113365]PYH66687.1 hypothetical protein BO88DRAFT_489802 [Aspergillus vadensis CBS 113365]
MDHDQVVFLTGATGNFGGCILYKLAVQLPTKKNYVLCRRSFSSTKRSTTSLGITSDACIVGLGNTRLTSDPTVRTVWPHSDPRFSLYTDIEVKEGRSTTAGGAAFKELLRRIEQNPAMLLEPDVENNLTYELSKHLARHMPRAAETSAEGIVEMPIDSLMAVEIQRGLRGDLELGY